jgi:hypothetical protein
MHQSRKYLSDPTEDVRVATENILSDFLREIRDVSIVRQRKDEHAESSDLRRSDEKLPDITMSHSERALFIPESDYADHDGEYSLKDEHRLEDYRGTGGRYSSSIGFIDTHYSRSHGPWTGCTDRLCSYHRDSHTTT